jgi:hypothetical protein
MEPKSNQERKGIGCGVFLILVGVGIFAERMDWFPYGLVPAGRIHRLGHC